MLDLSPAQPWRAETRPCPSKAAASEGNVEGLNDARTPLSDCFSILLDDAEILRTFSVDSSHFSLRARQERRNGRSF